MQIWPVLTEILKKVLPESTVFPMVSAIVVLKSHDSQPLHTVLWRNGDSCLLDDWNFPFGRYIKVCFYVAYSFEF